MEKPSEVSCIRGHYLKDMNMKFVSRDEAAYIISVFVETKYEEEIKVLDNKGVIKHLTSKQMKDLKALRSNS